MLAMVALAARCSSGKPPSHASHASHASSGHLVFGNRWSALSGSFFRLVTASYLFDMISSFVLPVFTRSTIQLLFYYVRETKGVRGHHIRTHAAFSQCIANPRIPASTFQPQRGLHDTNHHLTAPRKHAQQFLPSSSPLCHPSSPDCTARLTPR